MQASLTCMPGCSYMFVNEFLLGAPTDSCSSPAYIKSSSSHSSDFWPSFLILIAEEDSDDEEEDRQTTESQGHILSNWHLSFIPLFPLRRRYECEVSPWWLQPFVWRFLAQPEKYRPSPVVFSLTSVENYADSVDSETLMSIRFSTHHCDEEEQRQLKLPPTCSVIIFIFLLTRLWTWRLPSGTLNFLDCDWRERFCQREEVSPLSEFCKWV